MQPGDVVKLKSGSTPMTIARANDRQEWVCIWYVNATETFETKVFPEAVLEVYQR